MPTYDRSTVHEVFDLLREFGPDTVITIKDVMRHMPWLESNQASAALGLLSQSQHGILNRLEKDGRIRRYVITKNVYNERRFNRKPQYAKRNRGKKDDYKPSRGTVAQIPTPMPNEDVRQEASDLLLEAAMLIEPGGGSRTENLNEPLGKIKDAFWLLKKTASAEAQKED